MGGYFTPPYYYTNKETFMSRTPVLIIEDPQTCLTMTRQMKDIKEVTMLDEKSVCILPYINSNSMELVQATINHNTYKYATRDQAENVHRVVSMALAKGCSARVGASGDGAHIGAGS
jgi:CHAT domain-containing protein